MPKSIKVTPGAGLRVKKTGVFNLDKIYKDLHSWLDMHHYTIHEKEHTDKESDKGHTIITKWLAEREIDDLAKFESNIAFLGAKIHKTDNGLFKGSIHIIISASVILDYKKKWTANAFSNFLFDIYTKYITKDKINDYYGANLVNELLVFHKLAKSLLEMYP